MSAYLVDAETIDALVGGGLRLGEGELLFKSAAGDDFFGLTTANASAIGRMLVATNVASLMHCYSDDTMETLPGPIDKDRLRDYSFQATRVAISPIVLLKILACYEYQSCEHPGWKTSDAKMFCDKLRQVAEAALPPAMLEMVRNPDMPGRQTSRYKTTHEYDQAPWGIDAEDLEEMRAEASQARAA